MLLYEEQYFFFANESFLFSVANTDLCPLSVLISNPTILSQGFKETEFLELLYRLFLGEGERKGESFLSLPGKK